MRPALFLFLIILLLLSMFVGCSNTQEKSTTLTLSDDGGRYGAKIGSTFRIRLRVYPPYKWIIAIQPKSDVSGPTRIKGEIPGDVEYDVFFVDVQQSGRYVFYLTKNWPSEHPDRSFEFHVIAHK